MIFLFCSIIGHPWICENGVAPDRALDPAVMTRLKQFSAMNKLKRMALRVCLGLLDIFLRNTIIRYKHAQKQSCA